MHAKQTTILETKFPNALQVWKLNFQRAVAFALQHKVQTTHNLFKCDAETTTKQVQALSTSVQKHATM
jgi:hypothetical protein